MLHRAFGNLDNVVQGNVPFIGGVSSPNRIGIVESVDSNTHILKVRDCQTGQRGIECVVLQPQFSTAERSGSYIIPVPESKVVYFMDGGNYGVVLGNLIKGVNDPKKEFIDGLSANPGVESFFEVGSEVAGELPSDFGYGPGDQAFLNQRGKIKLTTAGVIVIKSGPFCYQYMLPAKQARLSQYMYDEERGIGYIKRRTSFFCSLEGLALNANYKVEQMEDIPTEPEAIIREETGFADRKAALSSSNYQSDTDVSGHILQAISSSVEILKARTIRRTMIAKTKKVQGVRVLYLPVYKEEKRVDGTVIEQVGHIPASPVYNLEIVKSPTGYMHVISRSGVVPRVILKIDPILGTMEIHGDIVALTAKTAITMTAPLVQVNGGLSSSGGVVNLQSLGTLNLNAPNVNIDAQAALTLNAPLISSLPVPVPPVPIPPVTLPPIPVPLPIDLDNTTLDEELVD